MTNRASGIGRASELPDRDLMQRVADGDEQAFTSVYRKQAPLLFSVIFHIVQDGKEAEDVLQETFVQIWRKAATFSADRGSFSTWSVMIARHKAIDKIRARQRYSLATQAAAAANDLESEEYANDKTERQILEEERDRIQNAMRGIDQSQREVILLAFFSGLTHVQIAQRLEAPLGTVKARIRRGLLSLREALGPKDRQQDTSVNARQFPKRWPGASSIAAHLPI